MQKLFVLTLSVAILFSAVLPINAQDPVPQQPAAEDLAKQKEALEKNAYRLLDQVIDEAQSLRLPENRTRIQINAADLLWERNQARARSLFALASDSVVEMARTGSNSGDERRGPNQDRRAFSLRQELVFAAARHDAPLAYQLLAATKLSTPPNQPAEARNPRMQVNSDENLEQSLLARVAALDPKVAAQNAEQMMEKGQFPRSTGEVIRQLYRQDAEAGSKLADKTVKRIQAANLLTNNEAGTLAQTLLNAGPRMAAPATATASTDGKPPAPSLGTLDLSLYTDLLSTVIDTALKATPQTQNNQRGFQRGAGPRGGPNPQQQNNQPSQPTDAQLEQNNARRLLGSLQRALPSIDQYFPGRATAVRQKMTELGMSDPRANLGQMMSELQQNPNSETLVQAAAAAPAPMQARLYQQAAARALDDGNSDRARQIATDHLQAGARDSIMQRIDFREMAKKADATRLDEIRQNLSRLPSETDKVSLLLQIANDLQKENPKAQLQMLEEARQLINHRATNYNQFEDQLRVASAFVTVDPARSFEVMEPGITQLNELLSAAAVLSGFEINLFRDGEMTVGSGGSGLSSTINRYGQELALLAKTDFERSETLAGRFQFTEPRIMARLSIIQGVLGRESQPGTNVIRNLGGGNIVNRRN